MKRVWVLLSIVWIVVSAFTLTSYAQAFVCEGAPTPQLEVGGRGRVSPGQANNVRDQATTSGVLVGQIAAGTVFDVLAGPTCADGYLWWQVESDADGVVGWTVEGQGDEYWLLPIADDASGTHSRIAFAQQIITPNDDGTNTARAALFTTDAGGIDVFEVAAFEVVEQEMGTAFITEIAWSPDGSKLAFIVGTDYMAFDTRVYIVDATGDNLVTIEERPGVYHSYMSWSPDSTQLVYLRDINGRVDVWRVSADAANPGAVTGSDSRVRNVYWSPDGTLLAYAQIEAQGDQLYVVPPQGGEARAVLSALNDPLSTMAWENDSQTLIVGSYGSGLLRVDVATGDIQVIVAAGGYPDALYAPVFSPDQAYVAYFRDKTISTDFFQGGGETLFINDPDGSNERVLVEEVYGALGGPYTLNYPVSWSPDSTALVFGDGQGVYVVDVESGESVKIAEPSSAAPQWQPPLQDAD